MRVEEFESDTPLPEGFEKTELDWTILGQMVSEGMFELTEDLLNRYGKTRFKAQVDYIMDDTAGARWVEQKTTNQDRSFVVRYPGHMKSLVDSMIDDLAMAVKRNIQFVSWQDFTSVKPVLTDALNIRFSEATGDSVTLSMKLRYTYRLES